MNWISKIIKAGEKIKKIIKDRPTKEDIAKSDWTSCCRGPILKKDLEHNLWVCPDCNKHHKLSPKQRFEIVFGKNNFEILKTPIPKDDPLKWKDSKSYKDRLKVARKKTNQNCAVMIAKGNINGIEITAGAINFDFIGGSCGAAESEAIISKARSEAQSILSEGKAAADKIKEDTITKAKDEASKIREDAQHQIQVEKDKAISDIRKEVVDISISVAEKLINKNISEQDNNTLIEESLKKINKYEA